MDGTTDPRLPGRFSAALALALAVSSCFPGGAVFGEPVPAGEAPTDLQPDPPEVAVKVVSIGLDGHVAAPERPTVARLSLANRGPARRLRLTFEEVVREPSAGVWAVMKDRVAPLEVTLRAGEEREIDWAVPVFNDGLLTIAPESGGLYAVARDESGRILGAARAPRAQTYGMPIAVLAESDEVAIAIQNEILRAATGKERPAVALVTGGPPAHFWEYEASPMVVLARPLSGLSAPQRTALRRFVTFGGALAVSATHAGELTGMSPGLGEVILLPEAAGTDGRDRSEAWRGLVGGPRTQVGLAEASLPLEMHIDLPGTGALLGMIGLIVLLVGPALHIALARMRRREWAWVGVPGLSLRLAIAMYGLASGSRGAANGVEIQHLRVSIGEAPDAVIMTQVRVQSKLAATKTVRLVGPPGSDPRHDNLQRFLYGGGVFAAPPVRMSGDAVEVGPMAMHRWSSQDLAFASAGARIPRDVRAAGDGRISVANTAGMTLTEVDLYTHRGWSRIASSLAPGARVELPGPPEPEPDPLAGPIRPSGEAWAAAYARSSLLATAASVPKAGLTADLRVLARCPSRDLPRVEVSPPADEIRAVDRCLWIVPGGTGAGGAP